jgi:regulator of cell morphogenesis and NO signaling
MNFTGTSKVREIVRASPRAAKVFEEAGVDYCCGGESSLNEACIRAGATPDAILERLRAKVEQAGPDEVNWAAASLTTLAHYIVEQHHRYVRNAIPRVSSLLEKVRARHGASHPELIEIEERFLELAQELQMHMHKEEQILFPYIEALDGSAAEHGRLDLPCFETVRNPVNMMIQEHDSAGGLLKAMRKLSSGYQVPTLACDSYRELYRSMKEFEADLHTHIHLENNILFPRAIELEAARL